MATDEPKPVTPLPFIDALLGYQKTAALKAAIELGVVDAIGAHGADVEAVCAKTNTSAHGARILCDYLTVLGFLEKVTGAKPVAGVVRRAVRDSGRGRAGMGRSAGQEC